MANLTDRAAWWLASPAWASHLLRSTPDGNPFRRAIHIIVYAVAP
jgi:hypothetical protein